MKKNENKKVTAKTATKKTTSNKATSKKVTTAKTTVKAKVPATKTAPAKVTAPKKSTVKKAASTQATKTKNKEIKKDEFRTHKSDGHPSYIYAKVNGKYKYLGITHSAITNKTKNIKLEENPNPNDKTTAYMRPTPKIDKTKNFKGKKKGWELSQPDKEKVKLMTKNSKKK